MIVTTLPSSTIAKLSKLLPAYQEFYGGPGDDILYGAPANLFGPPTNSMIYAGEGRDTVYAGYGHDVVWAGGGIDFVYAGYGNDTVYGGGDTDFLYGEDGNDTLFGEQGWDWLYGGNGDDVLDGGAGSDRLDGGAGADRMMGGLDNDLYAVNDKQDQVIENAGEGIDEVESYIESYVLPANVEHLYLRAGAFDGSGNGLDNRIFGNEEDNYITGHGGNDELKGYAGFDNIHGGDGDDKIWGGADTDVMSGGAGADTFIWMFAEETGAGRDTRDVILDFNPLEGDRIDLRAVDADWTTPGVQHFSFVANGNFTAPGQISFYVEATNPQEIIVRMNTDSDSAADATILLQTPGGLFTPDAGWLLL